MLSKANGTQHATSLKIMNILLELARKTFKICLLGHHDDDAKGQLNNKHVGNYTTDGDLVRT